MASHAFITKLSRRAMLAGSGGALAAPLATVPSRPVSGRENPGPGPDPDPDADLLRWMAFATRRWQRYETAQAAATRGLSAMARHPDYPDFSKLARMTEAVRDDWADLAERSGYTAARGRATRAYARFDVVARTAFAMPASTPRGLHAKLQLAVTAALGGDYGERDNHGWLGFVLADLERLMAEAAVPAPAGDA